MGSSTRGAEGGGKAVAGDTDCNDGSSGGADGSGFVASAYEGGLSSVVAGPSMVCAMFSARMFLVTLSCACSSSTLQLGHQLHSDGVFSTHLAEGVTMAAQDTQAAGGQG